MVHITRKETAGLLLGQKLQISYQDPRADESMKIIQKGTVVAVRFHPFEDCSVNLKFDTPLPHTLIDEFKRLGKPQQDHRPGASS